MKGVVADIWRFYPDLHRDNIDQARQITHHLRIGLEGRVLLGRFLLTIGDRLNHYGAHLHRFCVHLHDSRDDFVEGLISSRRNLPLFRNDALFCWGDDGRS